MESLENFATMPMTNATTGEVHEFPIALHHNAHCPHCKQQLLAVLCDKHDPPSLIADMCRCGYVKLARHDHGG